MKIAIICLLRQCWKWHAVTHMLTMCVCMSERESPEDKLLWFFEYLTCQRSFERNNHRSALFTMHFITYCYIPWWFILMNYVHQEKRFKEQGVLPSPLVTGVMPVKQLIAVVFPAPLGPRRQNSWSFAKFTHKPWRQFYKLAVDFL